VDNDLDFRYYDETNDSYGVYGPIKHWCLLGEIVEIIPWIRPMFKVKDNAGEHFLVAFHLDGTRTLPSELAKYAKPGNTMTIMYAEQHYFADGQIGVRLEDVDRVKVDSVAYVFDALNHLPSSDVSVQFAYFL